MRIGITRVGLFPGFADHACFLKVSCHQHLVGGVDEEPFAVVYVAPQLPGPGGVLG